MNHERTRTRSSTLKRVAWLATATLAAVLLTCALAAAQNGPDFEVAKAGPRFATEGDVITYTIDVTNQSGNVVPDAVLSDELPDFVTLKPGSCRYRYESEDPGVTHPCFGPGDQLWELDLLADASVHTTFAVTVEAGTLALPVVNQAELLIFDDGTLRWTFRSNEVTTTLNPYQIHLPLVAKNFGS